jgi:large subunit ribosomal protein L7/L12
MGLCGNAKKMLQVLSNRIVGRTLYYSRRCSSTTASSSQFNVFAKMSDGVGVSPTISDDSGKKRPPSKRVMDLADQILSLSLIEAADLCDICQERLSERTGGIPLRAPFPHPGAMFGGAMPMMGQPGFMPPQQGVPNTPPSESSPVSETSNAAPAAPVEEAKSILSVKLVSYAADKRVGVIKEIRGILGLGLKESKELVESVPKVVKRGLPREEAEELKKKLEAAGGVVELS